MGIAVDADVTATSCERSSVGGAVTAFAA